MAEALAGGSELTLTDSSRKRCSPSAAPRGARATAYSWPPPPRAAIRPGPLAALLGIDVTELARISSASASGGSCGVDGPASASATDLVRACCSGASRRLGSDSSGKPLEPPHLRIAAAAGAGRLMRRMSASASAVRDHVRGVARSRLPRGPEDDRILAANDAGCALLGYTREELLGMMSRVSIRPRCPN